MPSLCCGSYWRPKSEQSLSPRSWSLCSGGRRQTKQKLRSVSAVMCGKIQQAKGSRGWVSEAVVLGSREGREGHSEVTLSREPDRGREGALVRDSSRRAVKAEERPVWKLRLGGHLAYLRKRAAWVPRRCSSGRVVPPDNSQRLSPAGQCGGFWAEKVIWACT